jgi:hypothetical protein
MDKQLELAYLSGIFDGEGWIQVAKGHATPTVTIGVSMCCKPIIDMLQARWNGRVYNYPRRVKGLNDLWEWKCSAKESYAALFEMKPFLIVKEPIIDWAIELTSLIAQPRNWVGGKNGHRLPDVERRRRFELAALIQENQRARNGRTPLQFREYHPRLNTEIFQYVEQLAADASYDGVSCVICGAQPIDARNLCGKHYEAARTDRLKIPTPK